MNTNIPSTENQYSKERIRYAVLSLFLAQGLCCSTWLSRILDVKDNFSIDDLFYWGLTISMIPIGKFLAIPIAGYLLPRLGSKKTVQIASASYSIILLIIGLATNIYVLGAALLLFGIAWNTADISFNTQAIEAERVYGKPTIATFHAGWSFAACIGALIGFLIINLNVSPAIHFISISIISLGILFFNSRYLLDTETKNTLSKEKEPKQKQRDKKFKLPELLLIQLGLIWLLALVIEGTMFDWSGVYFDSVIQAPKSLQIGFLVFMVMMTVGRLIANWAYRMCGKVRVLQIAGGLIFIGFFTSSVLVNYVDAVVAKVIINSLGFMLIGLGISSVVPTLMSIVGDKAQTAAGIAITTMASISFIGPLITPLLVGFISKELGMEYAYMLVGLLGLVIMGIVFFSKPLKR